MVVIIIIIILVVIYLFKLLSCIYLYSNLITFEEFSCTELRFLKAPLKLEMIVFSSL